MAADSSKMRSLYPVVFLVAGLAVLIYNFTLFSPILLAFFLIMLITLALNPVVLALRRFLRRAVAAILMGLVFLVIVALVGWAFYTPLSHSVGKFFKELPALREKIEAPLRRLPALPGPNEGQAGNAAQGLHIDAQQLMSALGKGVQTIVTNTAALVIVAITTFIGVLYMLVNPRPVFRGMFALVPEEHQPSASRIAQRVSAFVPRWALALASGMAIIGLMVFAAMWPILGLENAIVMGLLAFACESIPYVGAILAGIPALLLAFGMGHDKALWVVIAYVTIQLTEHNVINPLVVAGPLRQHPVAVIFAVMLCLAAFGILGVLLAVPLVETLQIVYDELYRPRYLPTTSDADLDRMTRQMLQVGHDQSTPIKHNGRHHFFSWRRKQETPG